MAFTRRIFTKEFRLNAAKLVVDEHRPAVDVARELDINPKSLYSWVRQYRSGLLQASLDGEDSVSAEQAEIARLRSVSDASVNFHFDATRSFHLKIGKIK